MSCVASLVVCFVYTDEATRLHFLMCACLVFSIIMAVITCRMALLDIPHTDVKASR